MLKLAVFIGLLALTHALTVKQCATDSAIQVNSIEFSPYPPNLSQGFKVTYDVDILRSVGGKIDIHVNLKRKVMWVLWIPIPCSGLIGSCTHNDICNLMNTKEELCVMLAMLGLPCRCPWNAQKLSGSNGIAPHDLGAARSFVTGDYWLKAEVTRDGHSLACIELEMKLAA